MVTSEVARHVDGISQKVLTQTLRSLERDGFVQRTVYAQVAPRVDDELTVSGRSLSLLLAGLREWAMTHVGAVLQARDAYDHDPGAKDVVASQVT